MQPVDPEIGGEHLLLGIHSLLRVFALAAQKMFAIGKFRPLGEGRENVVRGGCERAQ